MSCCVPKRVRVKSFVTMCNDEYVPKYANDPVKLARRTILVGTINPEGDGSYLRDQTGATRYYPVRVGTIALDDITAAAGPTLCGGARLVSGPPYDWWQMPEEATEELALTREARRKEGVFEGPRLEGMARQGAGRDHGGPCSLPHGRCPAVLLPDSAGALDGIDKDQVGKAIGKFGWHVKSSRARGSVQRLWHPEV